MAGLDDNGAKFGILLLASFSRIWTGHFEKSAGSKKISSSPSRYQRQLGDDIGRG